MATQIDGAAELEVEEAEMVEEEEEEEEEESGRATPLLQLYRPSTRHRKRKSRR